MMPTWKQSAAPDDEACEAGFQVRDVSARRVAYGAAGLVALVAVSAGLVAGLIALLEQMRQPLPATGLETTDLRPAPPRLEASPAISGAAVMAAAEARLNGYAWVDRDAGLARIPVERAMQLLAVRGWPDAIGEDALP